MPLQCQRCALQSEGVSKVHNLLTVEESAESAEAARFGQKCHSEVGYKSLGDSDWVCQCSADGEGYDSKVINKRGCRCSASSVGGGVSSETAGESSPLKEQAAALLDAPAQPAASQAGMDLFCREERTDCASINADVDQGLVWIQSALQDLPALF